MEIFYNNVSEGIYGVRGEARELELVADDHIVSVNGFRTEYVQGIWFKQKKASPLVVVTQTMAVSMQI